MTALRAASATDAGRVRASNQDIALVSDGLVAVADGMGGHAAGEVAAEIAVVELQNAFSTRPTLDGLIAATESANRIIFDRGEADADLHGMGTTLTAAAIVPGKGGETIAIVNVGDSRAYVLDNGQFDQLTEDHSLVEEMVRRGDLSPTEAAVHPHRHILTRALGIDAGIEVDSFQMKPRPGMRLLLCSDGLTNECSDDEIATMLSEHQDLQEAAQALVDQAMRHGGNDNITVVVADIADDKREVVEEPPVVLETPAAASDTKAAVDQDNIEAVDPKATTGLLAETTTRLPTSTKEPESPPATGRVPAIAPKRRLADRLAMLRNISSDAPGAFVPNGPMFTFRVALFLIAIALVIGGALGFIVWFNDATYFVGIKDGNVAIYNGRPNHLLWMHPTLVEESSLKSSQVLPSTLTILRGGILESSFANAKQVVNNLTSQGSTFGIPTTTTSPTTTTNAPIVTTTTVPVTTKTTTKAAA